MGDVSQIAISWRSVMMAMVCLPILLCAMLLLLKKVEKTPSRFLSALLFAAVFIQMPQIVGFANVYTVWPGLTFFPFATDLWFGPLVYLHGFSLLRQQALAWRKYLLLPGIVQSTYYTWAFLFLGDYKAKWAFTSSFHQPYIVPVESTLGILMLVLSLAMIGRMYIQYKTFINNTQSSVIEFDPTWLKRLIIFLLIATALYTLIKLLSLTVDLSYIAGFPLQILIMMSIAWLSIEAVWRLNLSFPKMDESDSGFSFGNDLLNNNSFENHPRRQQAINMLKKEEIDEDIEKRATQIRQAVINQQWFLEPRFSLKQLATNMASNEVYISRAINQGINMSFNDFINGLRVEHAKNMLTTSEMPLLTIALESGFNSKATFNRVFKDMTQCTPSQYKKGLKI
jgi:AraC-like DNA-binding protein